MLRFATRRLAALVDAAARDLADRLRPVLRGRLGHRRGPSAPRPGGVPGPDPRGRARPSTDRPFYVQYGDFVWQLLHGNLGYSFAQRWPVTDIVLPAAGVTAQLVLGAAVVWLAVAIPIGVIGALDPRSLQDRALLVPVLLGLSAPVFWVSPMLAYGLGYQPTQAGSWGCRCRSTSSSSRSRATCRSWTTR